MAKIKEPIEKINQQNKKTLTRSQKRLIFYILLLSLPCIQFALFYFYVNIDAITLAFERYDRVEGLGYVSTFVGMENFKVAWDFFANAGDIIMNSLKLYIINLVIVMGLGLVFSYYIAKKFMLAGLFRVILYIPSVISSVVLVVLYKYIVTDVFVAVVQAMGGEEAVANLATKGLENGLLGATAPSAAQYGAVLFYNIWCGFGINVMLFTGSMSGVDQSLIESAQLDGVNVVQEFLHIYMPMIFPTFTTFIVTGITAIFTNQMGMYTFFGDSGVSQTGFDVFGYYLFRQTKHGDLYSDVAKDGLLTYPQLSALAIILTAILVPLTLIVRKLMETYGPRVD